MVLERVTRLTWTTKAPTQQSIQQILSVLGLYRSKKYYEYVLLSAKISNPASHHHPASPITRNATVGQIPIAGLVTSSLDLLVYTVQQTAGNFEIVTNTDG